MQNKKVVLLSLVALLVAFFAAIFAFNKKQDAEYKELALNKNAAPFVRDYSASFGEGKKGIVIVEFLDPECEACKYFYPAVQEVYKNYYEDITFVIRYLANHKNSANTIKILEASRKQNKYKEVLETIFKYQSKTSSSQIWELLKEVEDLDVEKLKNDYSQIDISEIIRTDKEDANTLKVRGTPTFFVDGELLKELNFQTFIDMVESKIYK